MVPIAYVKLGAVCARVCTKNGAFQLVVQRTDLHNKKVVTAPIQTEPSPTIEGLHAVRQGRQARSSLLVY